MAKFRIGDRVVCKPDKNHWDWPLSIGKVATVVRLSDWMYIAWDYLDKDGISLTVCASWVGR